MEEKSCNERTDAMKWNVLTGKEEVNEPHVRVETKEESKEMNALK
jgi:hypothetical protein